MEGMFYSTNGSIVLELVTMLFVRANSIGKWKVVWIFLYILK